MCRWLTTLLLVSEGRDRLLRTVLPTAYATLTGRDQGSNNVTQSVHSIPRNTPTRETRPSEMANATPPPHKLRPSKGPSLVEIKTKHYLQCSNPITITAFTSLIAHLNSAREESDHGRRGMNQLDADRHIDQFRHEWFLGALSRVKPLELLQDGESEVYSDGRGGTGPPASTTDSLPSVLESEQDKGDPVPVPREGTTEEDEAGRRAHLVPPDAISRGLLAERTIKRALSLSSSSKHAYLRHKDFASLAAVARKAIRTTLRTHQPVYVSPGLLDGCDFTAEYRARGWAAPGIRWSVFRPDLIRFQEVVAAGAGGSGGGGGGGGGGGETGSRTVSWEVVEIKYSNKPRNFVRRFSLCAPRSFVVAAVSHTHPCSSRSTPTSRSRPSTVRGFPDPSVDSEEAQNPLKNYPGRPPLPLPHPLQRPAPRPFSQSDFFPLARPPLPRVRRTVRLAADRASLCRASLVRLAADVVGGGQGGRVGEVAGCFARRRRRRRRGERRPFFPISGKLRSTDN